MKKPNLTFYLLTFGSSALVFALALLIFAFHQVIFLEAKYMLYQEKVISKSDLPPVPPVDKNFTIIIPKIDVNTKVLPNIDPYNKSDYNPALLQAAAHAKGTSLPGEKGNVFIYAHSVEALSDVKNYNAVFYLLGKVKKDDQIYIVYKQKTYKYKITGTKIVGPEETGYLENKSDKQTITLMTCWPAGMPVKRLLVFGQQVAS